MEIYQDTEWVPNTVLQAIDWLHPQIYYQPMKAYTVEDPSFDSSQQQVDIEPRLQYTLNELVPDSTYTVQVAALNGAGEGNSSESVRGLTKPARECSNSHLYTHIASMAKLLSGLFDSSWGCSHTW